MEYLNYLSATWGPSVMKHSTISTNRFDWFPIAREFVAEASDLKDLVLWRVYEDAADIGFGIKSAKTGKIESLADYSGRNTEQSEATTARLNRVGRS
jgi:hypothetical protein